MTWTNDPDDARLVIDQLLHDFESYGEVHIRDQHRRQSLLVVGWVAEVHRLVPAALLLKDSGYGLQAMTLVRQALEFTVTAHWLAHIGEDGVDAALSEYQRNIKATASDAIGGPLELPANLLEDVTSHQLDDVDEKEVFRRFIRICQAVQVVPSLYTAYRLHCSYAHPTFTSATLYIDDRGGFNVTPKDPFSEHMPVMLAGLLVWAGRAMDLLVIGQPRKTALRQAAKRLACDPALPFLVDLPRPKKKAKAQCCPHDCTG